MSTLTKFLSLPLSEQKRIITAVRKIARVSRGAYYVDGVFDMLVTMAWSRHENMREDRAAETRSRFTA